MFSSSPNCVRTFVLKKRGIANSEFCAISVCSRAIVFPQMLLVTDFSGNVIASILFFWNVSMDIWIMFGGIFWSASSNRVYFPCNFFIPKFLAVAAFPFSWKKLVLFCCAIVLVLSVLKLSIIIVSMLGYVCSFIDVKQFWRWSSEFFVGIIIDTDGVLGSSVWSVMFFRSWLCNRFSHLIDYR